MNEIKVFANGEGHYGYGREKTMKQDQMNKEHSVIVKIDNCPEAQRRSEKRIREAIREKNLNLSKPVYKGLFFFEQPTR